MPHVLVAGRIHEAGLALLKATPGISFDIVDEVSFDSYVPLVDRADAIVLRTQPMPAAVIDRAARLRIVSRHGVGFDAVDVAALDRRGIPLTVVGDVNSVSVAEHTMMLMLGLAKQALVHDRAVRGSDWDCRNRFAAVELSGKTLLLYGFGRIGRRVAGLAKGFGMRVLAHDPGVDPDIMRAAGVEPVTDPDAALGMADVVSLHVPLSAKVLIGAAELVRMKPTAFLINTARGGMVDEAALVGALAQGRLAGAGLDVFASEPPPPDHPLRSSDRVLLSPHTAGLTQESAMRMSLSAVQNVLDYFAGRLDPALVVNAPARGTPSPAAPL